MKTNNITKIAVAASLAAFTPQLLAEEPTSTDANAKAVVDAGVATAIEEGTLMAADLKEGEVKTMNGEKFTVDIEGDGDIEINEAYVSSPDVRASNGIMHSVGAVLVPSSLDEFADLED